MTFTSELSPDERLLFELRPHASRLIVPALVLLIASPLTALLIGMVPDRSGHRVAVLLLVGVWGWIMLQWVVRPFLLWWNSVTLITDRRILFTRGLAPRTSGELPYRRVTEVGMHSAVLQRPFGSGSLLVHLGHQSEPVALRALPNIEYVHSVVQSALDAPVNQLAPSRRRAVRPQIAYAQTDCGDYELDDEYDDEYDDEGDELAFHTEDDPEYDADFDPEYDDLRYRDTEYIVLDDDRGDWADDDVDDGVPSHNDDENWPDAGGSRRRFGFARRRARHGAAWDDVDDDETAIAESIEPDAFDDERADNQLTRVLRGRRGS